VLAWVMAKILRFSIKLYWFIVLKIKGWRYL
jgi:hypothetical protein